ncbi:MAG: hypothetical protein K2X74_19080, partial [Acetobacteraceae bacterium]|nr:hypothetical protein [Acetobacteraceae bacterium]
MSEARRPQPALAVPARMRPGQAAHARAAPIRIDAGGQGSTTTVTLRACGTATPPRLKAARR